MLYFTCTKSASLLEAVDRVHSDVCRYRFFRVYSAMFKYKDFFEKGFAMFSFSFFCALMCRLNDGKVGGKKFRFSLGL